MEEIKHIFLFIFTPNGKRLKFMMVTYENVIITKMYLILHFILFSYITAYREDGLI